MIEPFNYYRGAVIVERDPQRAITSIQERFNRLSFYPLPRGQQPFASQSYAELTKKLGGLDLFTYTRIARVAASSINEAAAYYAQIQQSKFLIHFFELELNELLKAARASSGIRRFPKVAGIASSTVSNAERGANIPRPQVLRAYAQTLQLDPAELGRKRLATAGGQS